MFYSGPMSRIHPQTHRDTSSGIYLMSWSCFMSFVTSELIRPWLVSQQHWLTTHSCWAIWRSSLLPPRWTYFPGAQSDPKQCVDPAKWLTSKTSLFSGLAVCLLAGLPALLDQVPSTHLLLQCYPPRNCEPFKEDWLKLSSSWHKFLLHLDKSDLMSTSHNYRHVWIE